MKNIVLSYPTISRSNFDRIQDIRKLHDRLYEVVLPHFTFVFSTEKISTEGLTEHVKRKTASIHQIVVTLSKAIVVEDDSQNFFHAFLVPSVGNQEIIALHDLLYTDELAANYALIFPSFHTLASARATKLP